MNIKAQPGMSDLTVDRPATGSPLLLHRMADHIYHHHI